MNGNEFKTQKYSKLILASGSPQRFELLRQIFPKSPIEVIVSGQNESHKENETPIERVCRLALDKAMYVVSNYAHNGINGLVIGADTEIVLDGKSYGKPEDNTSAETMLHSLSGKQHDVITGFTIVDLNTKKHVTDYGLTVVKFKTLSKKTIENYINTGEPIGKAGAYGIQGHGVLLTESIKGSYSNVVGLPLEQLSDTLEREFQLSVWDYDRQR